jgi:SpoVK/Ycf46/Vps4 family AAA+-type ATPase
MKNTLISRWTRDGLIKFPRGKFENPEKLIFNPNTVEKITNRLQLFKKNQQEFHRLRLPWRYGFFFFGPSGSGKTAAGKAIALALDWEHFTIPAHEILDAHFLEKALAVAVSSTERVIVLEDVDLMIRVMEPHVFFKLLDHAMERSEGCFWIASSRHPEEAPKTQLLRPGRFDEAIRLEFPNATLRSKLLAELLSTGTETLDDSILNEWVENSQGLSYSHFEELRSIQASMFLDTKEPAEILASLKSYVEDQMIAGDRFGGLSDSTEDLNERVSHIDPRVLMAALDMSDVFRRLIEKVITDAAVQASAKNNSIESEAGSH